MGAELAVINQVNNNVINNSLRLTAAGDIAQNGYGFSVNGKAFPYIENKKEITSVVNNVTNQQYQGAICNIGKFSVWLSYNLNTNVAVFLHVVNTETGKSVNTTNLGSYALAFALQEVALAVNPAGEVMIAIASSATALEIRGGNINLTTGVYTADATYTKSIVVASQASYLGIYILPTTFVITWAETATYYVAPRGSTTKTSIATTSITNNGGYVYGSTLYAGTTYNITAPTPTTLSVVAGTAAFSPKCIGYETDGSFYYVLSNALWKYNGTTSILIDDTNYFQTPRYYTFTQQQVINGIISYMAYGLLSIEQSSVSVYLVIDKRYIDISNAVFGGVAFKQNGAVNPTTGMVIHSAHDFTATGIFAGNIKTWLFKIPQSIHIIATNSVLSGANGTFNIIQKRTAQINTRYTTGATASICIFSIQAYPENYSSITTGANTVFDYNGSGFLVIQTQNTTNTTNPVILQVEL